MSENRDTKADQVLLISDPDEIAIRESENGVRQYRAARAVIARFINAPTQRPLNQAIILDMHKEALDGIHPLAGTYRNTAVEIGKSKHLPPRHAEVADHVADMCAFVNGNWDKAPTFLAAYVLWRVNWIHPFADGNGRTARILSYMVLSMRMESILPGTPTVPDQIAEDKEPYYKALESSDAHWAVSERLRIAEMEVLIDGMLQVQLRNAIAVASV